SGSSMAGADRALPGLQAGETPAALLLMASLHNPGSLPALAAACTTVSQILHIGFGVPGRGTGQGNTHPFL
ncbi:MAG: hypothetical protein WAO53_09870, partial [Candidatus Methanoculleus thermohydrogenotrophicum]